MRAFKIGILIASAVLLIGAFGFAPQTKQELASVNNCHNQNKISRVHDTTSVCIEIEDDSSWFSWISGDSRSAQFHYLDLLELLTSSEDTKNPTSLKPLF